MFIEFFTRALPLFISWARWIQFTPFHYLSLSSGLLLPSHLWLGIPSVPFPRIHSPKHCMRLSSPVYTYISHFHYLLLFLWFTHLTEIGVFLYANFPATICSFLGPNTLLGTLLYNTLRLNLSQCDRPDFKFLPNNRENYSSVYSVTSANEWPC